MIGRLTPLILTALVCVILLGTAPSLAQQGAANGEWRSYGGDLGSTKYAPLAQIDADNFNDLEIAWRWTSVDGFLSKTMPDGSEWWGPYDAIIKALTDETPPAEPLESSGHTVDDRRRPLF